MCWSEAANTKVVRRFYEPAPKVILPESIHHHARGERIVWSSQPLGQLQTPAAGRFGRQRAAAKDFDEAARDFLAELIWLSPVVQPHMVRRPFGHAIGQLNRPSHQQRIKLLS